MVGRREAAGVAPAPLLLQRNAEERDAADLRAHDRQDVVDVRPFLDVVREVEVRVVQLVRLTLLRAERQRGEGTRGDADEEKPGHHQKFISRLTWKTGPFAPTGIG